MRRLWLSVCCIIALLAHAPAQAETSRATDLPLNLKNANAKTTEWLKGFAPAPTTFDYSIDLTSTESGLRIYQVTYPSPMKTPYAENNSVPAELYLPADAKGPIPAAIVLDILDGRAILPRVMARALAMRGVAALYFPMPYYNSRRPEGTARQDLLLRAQQDVNNLLSPIRQTVMDVRRAKAILASRPEIDPKRIGITGISLGGIMASLAAGVDGEFYRVAPIIAGGDIATLVFHARELRRVRQLLEEHGLARDDLAKVLDPVEPLNFASRIDPATCLMINAANDEVIPKTTTLALRKMIGDPTILWMPTGHYSCALFLPNAQQKVADFMLGQRVTTLSFDGPSSKPAN
jgi:dienelactone hydrolase